MEDSFINGQICSTRKLDPSMLFRLFRDMMLHTGVEPCDADESEFAYRVTFSASETCNWLTVCAEHWMDDPWAARTELATIALGMRMPCLRVSVHAHPYAELELFAWTGTSLGVQYMGEVPPEPHVSLHETAPLPKPDYPRWAEALEPITTLGTRFGVLEGTYANAEAALTHLASVLGIGKEKLMMCTASGEQQEHTVWMYFRRVDENAKQVTVRAAFKRMYGDALKPLGFIMPKLKQPYYVRLVNDEILHIIGVRDMKHFLVPFGGIATLYRAALGLDKSYRSNESWLKDVQHFYLKQHTGADHSYDPRISFGFYYQLTWYKSPHTVEAAVRASLEEVQRWILPTLNRVTTLRNYKEWYEKLHGGLGFLRLPLTPDGPGASYTDAAIQYLLDDPIGAFECQQAAREAARKAAVNSHRVSASPEMEQYFRDREIAWETSIRTSVHSFVEDPDVRQQTLDELARRKAANLAVLRTYGV